jgi:hypothetical protein
MRAALACALALPFLPFLAPMLAFQALAARHPRQGALSGYVVHG